MKYFDWVWARLNEPSTYAGFAACCLALAAALQSHQPLYIAVLAGIAAMVKRG